MMARAVACGVWSLLAFIFTSACCAWRISGPCAYAVPFDHEKGGSQTATAFHFSTDSPAAGCTQSCWPGVLFGCDHFRRLGAVALAAYETAGKVAGCFTAAICDDT